MKKNEQINTSIMTLGPAKIPSPVEAREGKGEFACFVQDEERILVNPLEDEVMAAFKNRKEPLSFERAGPRRKIYFDPSKVRCAIVSCGGLCPGTNDIIR
ncbi:MAG: ATP-dependent 6-phosphofructokinase, partial [Deltaproteobacteria bacterium]|nr:ATP-dependent 6-phosphofructokinase [Deltaproteobacteria bacterium]